MDPYSTIRYTCVVCGKHSDEHAHWLLVIENSWLDRIRVHSWHPVLADQEEMRCVCSWRHLEFLVTHWLTYANLQFQKARNLRFAFAHHEDVPGEQAVLPPPGELVGELTVHRESLSRLWTGSPEARESIFDALNGGVRARETPHAEASDDALAAAQLARGPASTGKYFREIALQ
jgi:hypothetical protein